MSDLPEWRDANEHPPEDHSQIDPAKIQEIITMQFTGDAVGPHVIQVQSRGLPSLEYWLQQGLGGQNMPRGRSFNMNERDQWECERMSRRECDNYMRLSPRERDYRNRLPHNEQYEFDKRYLR